MTRQIVFVSAALVLIGTTAGVAQQKRVVTTADYDRAVKMLAPGLSGLVVGDSVNATWLPTAASGTPARRRPGGGTFSSARGRRPRERGRHPRAAGKGG